MKRMLTGGVAFGGAALLVFGLAGCGVEEELDKADRKAFARTCEGLGIARDTPGWDQCMIQQQADLNAQERQNQAALQQQEAVDKENKHLKKQQKKLDREIEALSDY